LIYDATHRVGKAIVLDPVNDDGTDGEHAQVALAPRFPVHRERNTMLRLFIDRAYLPDRTIAGSTAFANIMT